MPGIINIGNCEYPAGVDLEIYVRGVCVWGGGSVCVCGGGGVQPYLKRLFVLTYFSDSNCLEEAKIFQ